PAVVVLDEPESDEAVELAAIDGGVDLGERERLVEAEPEHEALDQAHVVGQLLDLPRRPFAALQGGEVPRERRRVPHPAILDCADGADAETQVVAAEPVAEVVPGPKVATAGSFRWEAEVRGLVPAVAGAGERLDDLFGVDLHGLSLALELLTVCVREARSGLRFELVGGDVLGFERQDLGEVASEV